MIACCRDLLMSGPCVEPPKLGITLLKLAMAHFILHSMTYLFGPPVRYYTFTKLWAKPIRSLGYLLPKR